MKSVYKACSKNKMGVGVAVGIAIGAGIGSATGDMAAGVGFGVAFGVVMGALWNKAARRRTANKMRHRSQKQRTSCTTFASCVLGVRHYYD